ncbi:MAG: cytochrome c3 family protein [Nitrospirota bacterium]|nr:cytochrome c3 family protein [Nitrospirota bacterium]
MSRKTVYLTIIFSVAVLVFVSIDRQVQAGMPAGIACFKCHTMHNSQNGVPEPRTGGASQMGIATPECAGCHGINRPNLLKMDCIGCHAENIAGGNNISPSTGAPQVAHSGTDLAAGNFKYVFNANSAKGHNVHGFNIGGLGPMEMESNIIPPDAPPGYNVALDYGGWAPNGLTVNPLMCAGTNGCHGNRSEIVPLRSIAGAHHADDSALQFGGAFIQAGQGSTVGTSYRFLYGVQGGESNNWEATFNAATNHNEYKGETWGARGNDPRTDHTISSLCSTCHGSFHASGATGIGTGTSPWIRHPTDVGMVTTGEFAAYTYTQQVPVARVTLPSAATAMAATADNRIVMCLSCHRAHASANDDSLRWQYDATMTTPNGCYNCHSGK